MVSTEKTPAQRKLYAIQGNDTTFDSLEFVPEAQAQAAKFEDLYSAESLSKTWKPLPVLLERADRRGDFYALGFGNLAASESAVSVLKPIIGTAVEFLPIRVVGERDADTNEISMKPPKGLPKLFAIRPLEHVKLAPNAEAFDYDTYTFVNTYAFLPEDVADRQVFRVPGDTWLIISDQVRKAIKSARLKGVSLDDRVDWLVAAEPARSAREKRPKPAKEVPAPPPFDFERLGSKPRITPELWDGWANHWKWACDAIKARGGEIIRRPKIGKPVSEQRLGSIRRQMDMELPEEFAEVLTGISGKMEMTWSPDYESLEELPAALWDVGSGGGGPAIWDVGRLVEFAQVSRNHADSDWLAFHEGLRGRLPFLDVGNGDLLAFDLRGGPRDCPVVYLSHENEPEMHDRQLGSNFIDFMTRWSYLGCPGPDFPYMQPFYSRREKRLNPAGKLAERWRRWLKTGL